MCGNIRYKKLASEVNLRKMRILLVAKISRFRVYLCDVLADFKLLNPASLIINLMILDLCKYSIDL